MSFKFDFAWFYELTRNFNNQTRAALQWYKQIKQEEIHKGKMGDRKEAENKKSSNYELFTAESPNYSSQRERSLYCKFCRFFWTNFCYLRPRFRNCNHANFGFWWVWMVFYLNLCSLGGFLTWALVVGVGNWL